MVRFFPLLTLLFALSASCWAEVWQDSAPGGFQVKISVEPTSLKVNELVRVEVDLQYPPGYSPNFEEMKANLIDRQSSTKWGLSLAFEDIQPLKRKGDLLTQKVVYQLEPWLAGNHFLSFYNLSFYGETRGAQPVDFFTTIFNIQVQAPNNLPETAHLAQGVLPLLPSLQAALSPENRRRFVKEEDQNQTLAERNRLAFEKRSLPWGWIALFLAAIFALWLGGRTRKLFRRHREKSNSRAPDPRLQALEALEKLASKKLPEKGEFEAFYVEITTIVRDFIENNYRIRAPEQTTEEFLLELTQNPGFDENTRKLLKEFLLSADMVKFARLKPTLQDSDRAQQTARNFVEKGP